MIGFLVRRAVFGLVAIAASATIAFVLAWHAPGGPAVALLGEAAAEGQVDEIAARLGLDRPPLAVWLSWSARLGLGDLGTSWREQVPVARLILERLPLTAFLVVSAAVLALVIGGALGMALAAQGRRWPVAVLSALHAVPTYLIGHGLVMAFGLTLGVLPVSGIADARAPAVGFWPVLMERLRHLALPITALALHQLCFTALLVRALVGRELPRPYVLAAMARGCTGRRARWRHAAPNAAVPLATLTAARIGALVGGAVTIETAFALPGLGRLAVSAAAARDHPVVVGCVVTASLIVWIANLLVDALAPLLDPRLRQA